MHEDPFSGLPAGIEWRRDVDLVPYRAALDAMTARNAAVAEGTAPELVWLLEHPPVYTAGTSAAADELLDPRFDVVAAGRGGRYTYHGPGQRIGYAVLDLRKRARDVRGFVHALEGWVIDTLADFGVASWRAEGRVGIWTRDIDGREAKIGAIGVRIRRWVTMHGFSVNLAPDLSHFGGIVPCGIEEFGVTSLQRLGRQVSASQWDRAMLAHAADFLAALDRPCPAGPAPASDSAGPEQVGQACPTATAAPKEAGPIAPAASPATAPVTSEESR